MFLHKKGIALTGDQAEHLENTIALRSDAGNACTAGVPCRAADAMPHCHRATAKLGSAPTTSPTSCLDLTMHVNDLVTTVWISCFN